MITRRELKKAIEELEESPCSYQNCERLASLYVVYDHLYNKPKTETKTNTETIINEYGSSDFLRKIKGKNINEVMLLIDELMTAISVTNPKLYASVLDKIK